MKIQTKTLQFRYDENPVLQDLSLHLHTDSITFLLGPNGSGKSTLLKCLLGFLDYSGSILIDGRELKSYTLAERAKIMAYVPQHHISYFDLLVEEIVLMGSSHELSAFAQPTKEQRQLALHCLEELGIAGFSGRLFRSLSGGEQQLVLIARSLHQGAHMILMDEPTASLDIAHQISLYQLIKKLHAKGYGFIITSHQPEAALRYAKQALLLKSGKIIASGCAKEVLTTDNLQRLYDAPLYIKEVDGTLLPLYKDPS